MLRVATLVVGGLLVSGMVLSAQDAVSEVRQTLDARAAAVASTSRLTSASLPMTFAGSTPTAPSTTRRIG